MNYRKSRKRRRKKPNKGGRRKKKTRRRRKRRGGGGDNRIILFLAHNGVLNGKVWEKWRGKEKKIDFYVHAPPEIDEFSNTYNITKIGGRYVEKTSWCRESLVVAFCECMEAISKKFKSGIVYLVSGVDIPICPAKMLFHYSTASKLCFFGNDKPQHHQQWLALKIQDFRSIHDWRTELLKLTEQWITYRIFDYNWLQSHRRGCPDEMFISHLLNGMLTKKTHDWCLTTSARIIPGAKSPITWTSSEIVENWNYGAGIYIRTNWLGLIVFKLAENLSSHVNSNLDVVDEVISKASDEVLDEKGVFVASEPQVSASEHRDMAQRAGTSWYWSRFVNKTFSNSNGVGGIFFWFRKVGWTLTENDISALDTFTNADKYNELCIYIVTLLFEKIFVEGWDGWRSTNTIIKIVNKISVAYPELSGCRAEQLNKGDIATHESQNRRKYDRHKKINRAMASEFNQKKYIKMQGTNHKLFLTRGLEFNDKLKFDDEWRRKI